MDEALARAADARAVLIAGPTASGKSALAVDMAQAVAASGRAALVVNADSMQVYDALAILTARPDAAACADVPHHLYGHVAAATRHSVAAWLDDVAAVLADCAGHGRLPILVGGTGLYFKALLEGIAAVPPVPDAVAAAVAARLASGGAAALHRELAARDPRGAAALRPTDAQRVARALEVLIATGEPLRAWQDRGGSPLLPSREVIRLVVEAPSDALRSRIDGRFDAMMARGAVDETRALLALGLAPSLPAMKAIGVREIAAALAGETDLAEAALRAKAATRQYAKRQRTWFRNQFADWERLAAS